MKPTASEILSYNLVRLMAEKKMDFKTLGRKTGLADRTLRYIADNERTPSVDNVQKIADALNVTVTKLITNPDSTLSEQKMQLIEQTQFLVNKNDIPPEDIDMINLFMKTLINKLSDS